MQEKILIIGGTSGLGKKLCELYCLEECIVGVVGRRKELLEELVHAYPLYVRPFVYDISSPTCADDIFNIIKQLGGIDKLILTASIAEFNPALKFSIEQKTISINVSGYIGVLNAAYQYFHKENKGHIVIVTSIASARGNKVAPAYNASKAFQKTYLEGLRLKLKYENKNVCITELIPGYMNTAMAKGERLFWVANIDKAGRQAKTAIDKKRTQSFITKRWVFIYYTYKLLPLSLYTTLINSKIKFDQK